jgi:small subunit ribosomal protein S7
MPRGNAHIKKNPLSPDSKFQNPLVSKFINYIMLNGKKTVAEKIVYNALDQASAKLSVEQTDVFAVELTFPG